MSKGVMKVCMESADFEAGTMTFKNLGAEFYARAGIYYVVPNVAYEVLEDDLLKARSALALAAEDSMGDAEIDDILREIVAAEDDFRSSTGMQSNDRLSAAIERARAWVRT